MPIYQTTCTSLTGTYLYSDAYICRDPGAKKTSVPFLNKVTAIPIIGLLGAIARIVLSILHMIGHTLAAFFYWNSEHLYHVAKGGAECVNGFIELMPIAGRVYVWHRDGADWFGGSRYHADEFGNYFLIKIYNPQQPDDVDKYFAKQGSYPYLINSEVPIPKKPEAQDMPQDPSEFLKSITPTNLEQFIVVDMKFDVSQAKKGDCIFTRLEDGAGWGVNLVYQEGDFRQLPDISHKDDQTKLFRCLDEGKQKKRFFPTLKGYFDYLLRGKFSQHKDVAKLDSVTLKCIDGSEIQYHKSSVESGCATQ